jgi:hypothetical protein
MDSNFMVDLSNEDLERLNHLFYEYDDDKDGFLTLRGLHELILVSLDNFTMQHVDILSMISKCFKINQQRIGLMEFLEGYHIRTFEIVYEITVVVIKSLYLE